ncbi:N-terminal glutamine amidase-domain-containing protein [Cladochytrium replicatum]|nr:N-terminal glutamine amidase-domain-containing protein [Cladochytrium replicatum]
MDRDIFAHTAAYCEENTYRLLEKLRDLKQGISGYAVFVSNPSKSIPIWYQRAGIRNDAEESNEGDEGSEEPRHLVVWDYHVFAVIKSETDGCTVYDLDSTLEFPTSALQYYTKALHPIPKVKKQFGKYYRVVQMEMLFEHFASDRSHMQVDGGWISKPPPEPPIETSSTKMNLMTYVDMENNRVSNVYGTVMNASEFGDFLQLDANKWV